MKVLLLAGMSAAAALLMSGCTSVASSSYETLRLAISGPESIITADYVNSLDRPALSARLKQSEALLVLAARNDGVAEWHGRSQALVTQNGRLIQTAGLPDEADIIAPLAVADPFLQDLRALPEDVEVTRLVDFPGRYLTSVPQHARYRKGPVETLEIMGEQRALQRMDEIIRMPSISFRATNHYWFDPDTGNVLVSAQHLAPGFPPVHLVELTQSVGQP
ncbi:YjbF family lipoprotein [Pseudomonas sp. gcc21]|uniref:YjbF family lipoprotein n=1 Tax=Pseudomonas sp. gcc21 TaxID=2726989 RepID=UPI001452580C|nr:YjbF family lipoprotein [Pseudomonas sp. gcc21]QJD58687.1 YjbF family lipoprotein [Pseudomonas sp. gcc21]